MKRKPFSLTAALALLGCFGVACFVLSPQARAQALSSGEIDQLREKLASIKQKIENQQSALQTNAGDAFLNASQDPEEAVRLYFQCHWMVNFEREGREEREFDDWKDSQRSRVKDPRFLEGLQTQLRYLALSCKAAEAKDLSEIFPGLLSYGDGLMRLTEMPGQAMLQDISGSIFAEAYQLDELLRKNESWEMIPFNISGIYEKTVLPYLRESEPDKLMGAWDRRIAHQTQMVEFLESLESRGNRRDDRERSENEVRQMQGGRAGGIIRAHDQDDFMRDTLPELKLGKLTDMFQYVDQAAAATGLIGFIEGHIQHERAADWLERISGVLAAGIRTSEPTPTYVPPVTPTPPVTSGTTTSGKKIPPGLVPAN